MPRVQIVALSQVLQRLPLLPFARELLLQFPESLLPIWITNVAWMTKPGEQMKASESLTWS